jgi:hypothetical protein
MSSPNALATVTATLHHILSNVAPGVVVTTQSPSVARVDNTSDQINVFLYGIHYNPTFRNSPMPGEVNRGESAFPPMPLVLKYLITSYGAGDDDISGQEVLGQAMSLLHDHPLLGRADIEGISPDSDLQNQIEKVRITPDVLTLDDMSKLWTSFQSAEYRLSTGYELSVVLIESDRPSNTPLPVLKRGEEDRGASVLAAPAPSLTGLRFLNQKPSAELGDMISLLGEHLSDVNTVVRLQHPLLDDSIVLQPESPLSGTEMEFQIPTFADDVELGSKWPAGFYSVSLVTQITDVPTVVSNSVSMPLSPSIESIDPVIATAGSIVFTIECLPQIRDGQKVSLLFSDQIIASDVITTPADPTARTTITFTVDNALSKATPYVLRLRVDGADSIPIDFSGDTPEFDDSQKVLVT